MFVVRVIAMIYLFTWYDMCNKVKNIARKKWCDPRVSRWILERLEPNWSWCWAWFCLAHRPRSSSWNTDCQMVCWWCHLRSSCITVLL